jgi:four helix bundle protein
MSTIHTFKEMPLWQHCLRLAADIYQLTTSLPASERLGLGNSLQLAAVTLPSTLAKGATAGRSGFSEACTAARQSAIELETLLLISQQVYADIPVDDLLAEVEAIQTSLRNMAERLSAQQPAAKKIL